MLSTIIEY